jgi:hypothetical protein
MTESDAATLDSAPTATMDRRRELEAILDRWFEALVAHSPVGLPLAGNIRFTEQAVQIPVGDGLFVSATEAPAGFKIVATDEVAGQVGAIALMKIWDKPALVTVRLKVEDGRITEAEHVIADQLFAHAMANLETARPQLLAELPEEDRTPRDDMLRIASSYFDAIEQDDGDLCPFDDACVRRENGLQTTLNDGGPAFPMESVDPERAEAMARMGAMTCRDQLNTRLMQYITMIRPRRLQVIDETRGLVLGFPRFVHRGDNRRLKLRGVEGIEEIDLGFGPNDLQASELFRIRRGKVTDIEATGFINAYLAPTGWDDVYPETYDYEVTHPNTKPFRAGRTTM